MVNEVNNGEVLSFELTHDDFGLLAIDPAEIRGGTAAENALILREVLSGKRRDGMRAIVLANAAAALYLCDVTPTLKSATLLAAHTIDQGLALAKLDRLITFCQQHPQG